MFETRLQYSFTKFIPIFPRSFSVHFKEKRLGKFIKKTSYIKFALANSPSNLLVYHTIIDDNVKCRANRKKLCQLFGNPLSL